MKTELIVLRGKIKGLTLESEKIRGRINKFRTELPEKKQEFGEKRYKEWVSKREIGRETRYLNLAYGFLRGVPYWKIEEKTAENNKPCANTILLIVNKHDSSPGEWLLKHIEEWLAETAPVAPTVIPVITAVEHNPSLLARVKNAIASFIGDV